MNASDVLALCALGISILALVLGLRRNGNGERVKADDARALRDDERREREALRHERAEERQEKRRHDDDEDHRTLPFKG